MRVLQVNSVCGRGSTGKIAVGIAQRLADRGDACTIAYGRETPLGWDDTIRVGSDRDMLAHVAAARLHDASGFGSTQATREFVEDLELRRIDLVHLHNVHGYYLDVEVMFDHLRRAGIPVVWTLHDCWAFTGHCSYFDAVGCERWRDHCGHCPQRLAYPRSYVDRSTANLRRKKVAFSGVPDLTLVSPSRWLRDRATESFLGQYPCEIVPNEIDATVFARRSSDVRARYGLEGLRLVLAVANIWEPRKGLQHLVELAPLLREDEKLVVVGVDDHQRKQLPPGVLGLPRTSSALELAEVYSACDVFVNPTMEDISSLTNLEAAACGLPVVSFASGGAAETLDGLAGVAVIDRTARGLRAALDEVERRGEDNVGVVQTRQAGRVPYQGYLDLYDAVLEARA